MYHIGQLVHALATVVGVHVHILCAKVAPLKAIDRTEIPLLPMLEPNTVQAGRLDCCSRPRSSHSSPAAPWQRSSL